MDRQWTLDRAWKTADAGREEGGCRGMVGERVMGSARDAIGRVVEHVLHARRRVWLIVVLGLK